MTKQPITTTTTGKKAKSPSWVQRGHSAAGLLCTEAHVGRSETVKMNATIGTFNFLCDYFGITLADFFSEAFNDLKE